ncbi:MULTISPECIES: amidase [Ramlibacter]|uniref:Amidase n=1 Tax=Ramlibacter aquaticus TaxID=2780094 RepID=A0ABR9SB23_9BURK|nr:MULTISPECIES: amidase [Ramlibacter]MBE7938987.1 amidase [Ramlibacter aquaticus]
MLADDPTSLPAHTLSARIHDGSLRCVALMQATLARIAQFNPRHNAIVNLAPEAGLLAQAAAADAELAQGRSRGWLHGIPMAIKDTADAAGFPTTRGSPLLARSVATQDGIGTARLRAAGAIVIGKTNVPEFGLGSHSFNEVFGVTRNAWDPAVSAGGSSGGAAVALALRLLPLADGSDFMGSLRNPAGWNHVFGMRPTQGRVPMGPGVADVWVDQLATEGPMARNVTDLARMLATQAGHDPRAPLSLDAPLEPLATGGDPAAALRGLRIGVLGDLDGHLPMEAGVMDACDEALRHMERAGAVVEPAALGMEPARLWDCWLAWRRALVGARIAPLLALPGGRERIKPEALWEYEGSLGLDFAEFMRASQKRTRFYHRLRALFERFDVLALPSAQAWPFPVAQRWPKEVGGVAMDTYHRWMEVTIYATLAGVPAISVPAGFHPERGWPMGLQLVGPHGADAFLLRVAAAYEAERAAFIARVPPAALAQPTPQEHP